MLQYFGPIHAKAQPTLLIGPQLLDVLSLFSGCEQILSAKRRYREVGWRKTAVTVHQFLG